jgi:hypothetical protein
MKSYSHCQQISWFLAALIGAVYERKEKLLLIVIRNAHNFVAKVFNVPSYRV